MKFIKALHQAHQGKVSDRWASYLSAYDRLLAPFQDQPLNLLEIGIQNGGSLEIWAQYFAQAQTLVGCDINPDCARLQYDDPRIHVVVANANTDAAEQAILAHARDYDVIIDDGSHTSADIILAFVRYFQYLKPGGVFVAEDLHCSYWQTFEGGLYYPYTSIAFFKRLADVINHEHWGIERERHAILQGFAEHLGVTFDAVGLEEIHAIEFSNSLCVVHKRPAGLNALGERCVAGQVEVVVPGHHGVRGQSLIAPSQAANAWATMSVAPEEQWEGLSQAKQRDKQQLAQTVAAHDRQIAQLHQALAERETHLAVVLTSTSWRMTYPLRFALDQLKRVRRAVTLALPAVRRAGGVKNAARKALRLYQNEGLAGIKRGFRLAALSQQLHEVKVVDPLYLQAFSHSAETDLVPRVLIIAEMSIPQCVKYRVQQKHAMLLSLGVDCTQLSWGDTLACLAALQTHSLVIFYRVPAYDSVISLMTEAKRLGLPTYWEVDDFIFDAEVLSNSKTLAALDKHTFAQLVEGAGLYRQAMLLCERGIASTTGLAAVMQAVGLAEVLVIENALDSQTLTVAAAVLAEQPAADDSGIVRIVYGSGTNTHNIDFEEAAAAILAILAKFPQVHFRLIGKLELPAAFAGYASQVETIPFCDYPTYLRSMAACDISIAPLENYVFNDSKSNIKYLEAAAVKLPSVCSPRAAFTQVMVNGENGFLCDTPAEWEAALTVLVTDKAKRVQVGEAAYATVMHHYTPETVAQEQVAPLLADYRRSLATVRVLSVNCYYAPRSFGGATIVAEAVNQWIHAQEGAEVHVFTTVPTAVAAPYALHRYEAGGVNVYGVGVPDTLDQTAQFDNPDMVAAFTAVLAVVQPDVVHFHSIQTIGVAVMDVCIQQGIPYAVTLHDAWWLCGRQFMINQQGKFCGQEKIEHSVCTVCVDQPALNDLRRERLLTALRQAALLLSPSQFFADFYRANGFQQVQVNKNGIVKPASRRRVRREEALRFGYVGGNTPIKGFHLIQQVFAALPAGKVKLVLVDNAVNLGFSSYHQQDLMGIPNVEIVPAYTQQTIDDFFAGIDVLLFPTQWKESFGLSVREALARHVWVIATDAGGVVEDIIPGQNGYIIPFTDTGAGLRQAVLDTTQHFERIPPGETVALGVSHIRFFDEQAQELLTLLKRVVSK